MMNLQMAENRKIFVFLVILGITTIFTLIFTLPIASASEIENLSAEVGTNFIKWTWNYNETTTVSIYIDGVKKINETELDYFILSDLNPREIHAIALVNVSNNSEIYAMDSQQTFYPPYIFAILLTFMLIFLVITLFLQDSLKVIMFGTMSFVLGLFLYRMSYPYQYQLIAYPCLAFSVLAVIWIMIAAISLFSKTASSDSWEDERV